MATTFVGSPGEARFGPQAVIVPSLFNAALGSYPWATATTLAKPAGGSVAGFCGQTATVPSLLNAMLRPLSASAAITLVKSSGMMVCPCELYPQATTDPPAGLANVVAVAQGYDPSAALKSDGTITAW